jgi:hypothetical protein
MRENEISKLIIGAAIDVHRMCDRTLILSSLRPSLILCVSALKRITLE